MLFAQFAMSTVIKFASNTGIFVNNGGTLISCGTPDNPIIYTSDSLTPDCGDYYCPIYIEETASTATKITYSYIEYAVLGIVTSDRQLNCAIENNYLYKNAWGIVEYGIKHTDIINNLIEDTYNYGINVNMASEGTGQGSADTVFLFKITLGHL